MACAETMRVARSFDTRIFADSIPGLFHVLVIFDRLCKDCWPVQRGNVCTSFDRECVSVHVPPVRAMSVSSTCSVPLSLLCSPPTLMSLHTRSQRESSPLAPRVPRDRRILALLPGKKLIWTSHTFFSREFIDPWVQHVHSVYPRKPRIPTSLGTELRGRVTSVI